MKKQITGQQKLMKNLVFLVIVFLVLSCSTAFGYGLDSHYQIAVKAIQKSSLNDALEQMGFTNYEAQIKGSSDTKPIYEWIGYGSQWEDEITIYDYGLFNKRGSLYCHFYNPITDKGYTNSEGDEIGQSLIDRANDLEVNINGILMNEWSYPMAKDLYYAALTGDSTKYTQWIMRDGLITASFIGKENMSSKEREQFFAWTFQALGHTLHLIEDASVPAHTRNDFHIPIYDSEPYEGWTESKADFAKYNPGDSYFPDILEGYGSDPWNPLTNFVPDKIIKSPDIFIDSGYLVDASTPPITGFNQGLAEYSHANFLSADTVFSDGTPNTISTIHGLADIRIADLGNLVFKEDREIGDETYSFFYVKNNTAQIDHFALCGIAWQIKQMEFMNGQTPETGILYTVDDPLVNEDYARKLIPRAVGYSAGLLDYFFRGNMHVTSLPVFYDNSIYAIMLYVKNITSSQEIMTNGNFSLVVRYTPTGGNPDGSNDIFVRAYDVESGELQYNDGTDVQFYLTELIPMENYESVKCMLVFKGKLGNEENAVIGKSFSLGEIKFNEEWDNSLNGNYPWTHTTPDENPDNGSTSNVTDNGILVKDNIRYIGYDTPRFNSSPLDFVDLNHPNGLLITPDTYLQFKIDDLSINEQPPAPEGSTSAWQYLRLRFNNQLGLQFTQEGQGVYWDSNTAYYTFNLGWIIVVNIHSLFQNNGIAIPEPFYLQSIGLTQQLWNLEELSTVEHHQHMEVDFMRIVERYMEPE